MRREIFQHFCKETCNKVDHSVRFQRVLKMKALVENGASLRFAQTALSKG